MRKLERKKKSEIQKNKVATLKEILINGSFHFSFHFLVDRCTIHNVHSILLIMSPSFKTGFTSIKVKVKVNCYRFGNANRQLTPTVNYSHAKD